MEEASSSAEPPPTSPREDGLCCCPMCDFSCRQQRSLVRHLKHHGSNQSCQCPFCSYSVGNVSHLSRHINQHHHMFKEMEEEASKMSTRQNHQLGEHQQIEENCQLETQQQIEEREARLVRLCGKCDFTTKSLHSMRNHEALHEKKSEFQCPFCSYSVSNISHLTRHMKHHHLFKDDETVEISTFQEEPSIVNEPNDEGKELQEAPNEKSNNELDKIENNEILEEPVESEGELEEPLEKLFRCSECGFKTKSHYSLDHHRQLHLNKSSCQCPKCSFSVGRLSHLNRHLREHHDNQIEDGEANLSCGKCDYVAKTLQKLRNHESLHGNKKNGYQCPMCCYSVSSANPLSRHINDHHHRKNEQAHEKENDELLGETMESEREGRHHEDERDHEKENGEFLEETMEPRNEAEKENSANHLCCKFCEFSAKTNRNFRRHELCHLNKSKFQCPHCSFSISTPSHLSRHVNLHHQLLLQEKEVAPSSPDEDDIVMDSESSDDLSDEDEIENEESINPDEEEELESMYHFYCPVCEFVTRTLVSIQRHELCHRTKSKFQCPHCSFSVGTPPHLSRHINSHHRLLLEVQEKASNSTSPDEDVEMEATSSDEEGEELETVESAQPGDEELELMNLFYCPVCEFSCKTLASLKMHELCHRNKSKFQCPYCSFSVSTASHLSRHINGSHQFLHLNDDGMDSPDDDIENFEALDETIKPEKGGKVDKDKSMNLYYCRYCEFSNRHKGVLKVHESYHLKESRLKCPHCSYSVGNPSHLTRHINNHHHLLLEDSASLHELPDEDDEMDSASPDEDLSDEVENDDVLEEPLESEKEEKEEEEISINPEGDELESMNLFYCPVCEFVGGSLTSIKRHELCHRNKSKFQCPHCSFSVGHPSHLSRHVKCHHRLLAKDDEMDHPESDGECSPSTNLLKCDECDYSTDHLPNLRRHEGFHRVKSNCQCPHCSYSVANACHLNRHVASVHHSIKDDEVEEIIEKSPKKQKLTNGTSKFNCEFCDFSTDRADGRKKHIWGHERNQKFKCSRCNFTANFLKTIVFHEGHHHRHQEPSKPSNMRECYVPLRDLFSHINLPEATLLSNAKSWVEVKEIEVEMMKKTIRSSIRKIETIHSSENQVLISKIDGLKEELKLKSSRKDRLTGMIGELLSKKSRVELKLLKMRGEILNVGLEDGAQMMEERVMFLKEELKGIEKGLERLSEEENGLIKDLEDVRSTLNALEVDLKNRNRLNEMIDSTQMKIVDGFQLESRLAKIRLIEAKSGARQRRNSWLKVLENVIKDDSDDC